MRQARTTDQTLADTLVLLPDGFASTHEPDDYLAARFRPWANEVAAIEASALALVPQVVDPRSATELLVDWEAEMATATYLGDVSNYSTATRAALAYALLVQGAPVCPGDFVRLALLIGETITITEMPATMCGTAHCGDTLNPPPGHFNILVTLPTTVTITAHCGTAHCGDYLGRAESSVMEPIIRNGVPIGVVPTFLYTG